MNKQKTKKKVNNTYKINVYAKNMGYMITNQNTKQNTYNENKDKYKILLSKLTEALGENQWLKYSKAKYRPIQHIDKTKINTKKNKYSGFKPMGSYYSKGSWLFHSDNCCELDREIIFIEVDYNTIYRIKGKTPFTSPMKNTVYQNKVSNFMNKYGENFDKDKCTPLVGCFEYDTEETCNKPDTSCIWDQTIPNNYIKNKKGKCIDSKSCSQITTEKKCNTNKQYECGFLFSYKIINWGELYKNYNGFAIYPFPKYEMLTSKKNRKDFFSLYGYDVETLVLWDHTPVIKYHNLGTIREILKETGMKYKDMKDKNIKDKDISDLYEYFIPQLIKKIQKINNITNNNKIIK